MKLSTLRAISIAVLVSCLLGMLTFVHVSATALTVDSTYDISVTNAQLQTHAQERQEEKQVYFIGDDHLNVNAEEENITCIKKAHGMIECDGIEYKEEQLDPFGSKIWITHASVSLFLVCFAGLMSGLTIGLLSFDANTLLVLKNAGEPQERIYAEGIMPLIEQKHLLLVTLLLCNAAAMEALPLYLDKMFPEAIAILISVTAVLLFGEIIPQAICSRYGLAIGYYMSKPVQLLMYILLPISWPISKVLDATLGHDEGSFFRREELKEFLDIHATDHNEEEQLTIDETTILKSVLDMADKTVKDCYTKIDNVFAVEAESKLNQKLIDEIIKYGHSRIPVYENNDKKNIIGGILVKSLIAISTDKEKTPVGKTDAECITVKEFISFKPLFVEIDCDLYHVLNRFREGHSHMAIVHSLGNQKDALGIVTLEDVIEEMIAQEIVDESDLYVDVNDPKATKLRRRRSQNLIGLKKTMSSGIRPGIAVLKSTISRAVTKRRLSVTSNTSTNSGEIGGGGASSSSMRDSNNNITTDRSPLLKK